jgi:hypothetical protein
MSLLKIDRPVELSNVPNLCNGKCICVKTTQQSNKFGFFGFRNYKTDETENYVQVYVFDDHIKIDPKYDMTKLDYQQKFVINEDYTWNFF